MTHAELAAVFRLLAGHIDNLGAVPQPAEPAPAPNWQAPTGTAKTSWDAAATPSPPAPLVNAPPPPPPPPAPDLPKPVIDLDTIKGIQQAFNQIRATNFPKLEENGVHDAVMTWALKEFQATAGIPVTGNIDEITLNTLHQAIFGTPRT